MNSGQKRLIKRVLRYGLLVLCLIISINQFLFYVQPHRKNKSTEHQQDEAQVASCDISGWTFAISALTRAKTFECKQQIRAAACTLKEKGSIHPTEFTSKCPLIDTNRAGTYHGCIKGASGGNSTFKNQKFYFNETNTVKLCVESCFQIGSVLAGVQDGAECYCGEAVPINALHGVFKTHCSKFPCPGDKSITCGGHLWMAVYETGFNADVRKSAHIHYVHPNDPAKYGRRYKLEQGSPVRILYFLGLNGRNDRQVFRLLRLIYRAQHYYYIHVDKRADYLYRRIVEVTKGIDNIMVTERRWAPIWGAPSRLEMYLLGIKEVMEKTDWKWEYLINHSESDLPLLPVEEIVEQLTRNKGYNFVASAGLPGDKLIIVQGINQVFVECDQYVWRIGNRAIPTGLWIDGGSDWFILHRDFLNYIIYGNDDLITGLKQMYKYSLMPAESFFHTVLHNSRFCQTYVSRHLRVISFVKGRSCHCNKIYDWCGCSPKTWDITDRDILDRRLIVHKLSYIARKFDPIIDVEIINFIESRMLGVKKLTFANHNSVWYNAYCSLDYLSKAPEHKLRLMESLARISTRAFLPASGIKTGGSLDSEMKPNSSGSTFDTPPSCHYDLHSIRPTSQWMYKPRDGEAKAILITFNMSCGGQIREMECWLERIPKFRLLGKHPLHPLLVHLDVGLNYDPKGAIFRDYLGGVAVSEFPTVRHEWNGGELKKLNWSSIDLEWRDSSGKIVAADILQLDQVEAVQTHQFALNDSGSHPRNRRPGPCTVTLRQNGTAIAETKFLVLPDDRGSVESLVRKKAPATTKVPVVFYKDQRRSCAHHCDHDDDYKSPDGSKKEQLDAFRDDVIGDFYFPKGLCVMDHKVNANSPQFSRPGKDLLGTQKAGSGRTRIRIVPELHNDKCFCISSSLPLCSLTPWSSAAPDPKSEFKTIRYILVKTKKAPFPDSPANGIP